DLVEGYDSNPIRFRPISNPTDPKLDRAQATSPGFGDAGSEARHRAHMKDVIEKLPTKTTEELETLLKEKEDWKRNFPQSVDDLDQKLIDRIKDILNGRAANGEPANL